MAFSASILVILLLALEAYASPQSIHKSPVTLHLSRHYNFTIESTIADYDRAKLHALHSGSSHLQRSVYPVPATNAMTLYTTEVGIGEPPTMYNLLVDTGSANIWIASSGAHVYKPTSGASNTGNTITVASEFGTVQGQEWIDTVTLGSLVIPGQAIGVVSNPSGLAGTGIDGVLGIGPTDLSAGTLSGSSTVRTVTDTAWALGLFTSYEVGISFEPTSASLETNGELSFGGADSTKFTGQLNYVPITTTSPSSEYVGIDQSISYGSKRTPILPYTAGITDTGTTLILLATDAFARYKAVTGAIMDATTGLLKLTAAQYDALQSLFFSIGGVEYELTKNAQIWPRSLNTAIGGTTGAIYLVVADIGAPSGEGLDFVSGYVFLERFYTVYDSGPSLRRFGIAQTPFTFATTN